MNRIDGTVFLATRFNGVVECWNYLPECPHDKVDGWPKGTWFQKRLEEMRKKEEADHDPR